MEVEVEAGNSLLPQQEVPTRDSERKKCCSIGKITSIVLIIVLGSAVSMLCYDKFYGNDEPLVQGNDK